MIKYMELNEAQEAGLINAIEDLYASENIETTGLEIIQCQDEGDVYSTIFMYEDRNCQIRKGKLHFTGAFNDHGFTDFEEKY